MPPPIKKSKIDKNNPEPCCSNVTKSKHKLKVENPEDVLSPLKRMKISVSSPKKGGGKSSLNQLTKTESIESDERLNLAKKIKKEEQSDEEGSRIEASSQRSKDKFNLIAAFREVATQEYYDIKSRLNIDSVPDCCVHVNRCKELHKNQKSNIIPIGSHDQELFKIYFQTNPWTEALTCFANILQYDKYPSAEMMHYIIDIILNAHEEQSKNLYKQPLMQRCIKSFNLIFETHPPCSKTIRGIYKEFLTIPYYRKINVTHEFAYNENDNDVFRFILEKLNDELKPGSPEGPLIDIPKSSDDQNEQFITVNEAHIKKKNYQVFETLDRFNRIERLFVVMRVLVELLEKDLAIWTSQNIHIAHSRMLGQNKPLIAWILWQNVAYYTGTIRNTCKNIMHFFVTFIKLNFPQFTVILFSRLINLLFNVHNMCENHYETYPLLGEKCVSFAEELFSIIQNENISIILKILDALKNKTLKHLLAKRFLKHYTKIKEDNFINLILDIFKKRSWSTFNNNKGKILSKDETNLKKYNVQNQNMYVNILIKIKSVKEYNLNANFPYIIKNNAMDVYNDVSMSEYMFLLYISLHNYIDMYDFDKILKVYFDKCHPVKSPVKKSNENSTRKLVKNSKWEFAIDFNNKIRENNQANLEDEKPKLLNLVNSSLDFISAFQFLKRLTLIYMELKNEGCLIYDYFEKIVILQGQI